MGNLLSRSTSYEEREKVIQNRYTYNSLYQLIQEEGFFDHSYNYDSLYNRIEEDGSANEINDFNQIIKNANSHFTYDLAGNLTQQKTHDKNIRYEYDIFDRLVRVTQNGEATEYTYDELNRRLTKISPNRIQYFIYQGQNEIGSVIFKAIFKSFAF
jgi:YD repeat-containing protein